MQGLRIAMPSIRRGTIGRNRYRAFLLMLRERIMFSAPALRLRNLRIADFYKSGF